MTARTVTSLVAAALFAVSAPCRGQQPPTTQPPPVRPLGPILNVSAESLSAVATAVQVSGGRVYVNDILARRIVLFDSTLGTSRTIADSTPGAVDAYGSRPGTLLPYRGDSALFISPTTLSMLVLSPDGHIARVMAMPPAGGNGIAALIGNIFGTPGFDSHGRLVYFSPTRFNFQQRPNQSGPTTFEPADSAFIVRFDFATRTLDTAGVVGIGKNRSVINRDDQNRFSVSVTAFPFTTVDDWAVASDGSIGIVRGRDYHVDWLNADGSVTSSPRMSYAWEHLNDDEKTALIDSAATAMQVNFDSILARQQRGGAGGPGGGPQVVIRGGGDGGGPGGPPRAAAGAPRLTAIKAALTDVGDYRPAFRQAAVRADAEGNLWIRTNKMVDGQPVYDIVNRAGQITSRVQLPAFRTIAGFGPGVVYMGVRDSSGVMHLERARIIR